MKKNQFLYTSPPVDFSSKMSVVLCYLEWEGKVLFLLTQPGKSQGMTWSVPGGKVEKNEKGEDALAREMFEETGIQINPRETSQVATFFARGSGIDFLITLYRVCRKGPQPHVRLNPVEHTEFLWISPQKALELPLMEGADECLKSVYGEMR